MGSKTYTIPPFCRWTFRCSDTFYVYEGDNLVGPNSSTTRLFVVETAKEARKLKVDVFKDAKFSTFAEVRNPYEANDGVPAAISTPIKEPTIQEMIRMYIQEAVAPESNEPETPEEFFDFDMDDDDGHLMQSPYEYEEMDEEWPQEPEEPKTEQSNGGEPLVAEKASNTPAEPSVESRRDSDNPAPPPEN